MSLLAAQADAILRAALREEYGIVVRCLVTAENGAPVTSPAFRGRQVLYHYRKELGDPDFLQLSIRLSPSDPDFELWIINRNGQVESAETVDIDSI